MDLGTQAVKGSLLTGILGSSVLRGWRSTFPLTIERTVRYSPFGHRKESRDEGAKRSVAGHAGHVGAQGPAARADARLGHHRAHRAVVRACPAARPGHVISRALSAGATGAHPIRMEGH